MLNNCAKFINKIYGGNIALFPKMTGNAQIRIMMFVLLIRHGLFIKSGHISNLSSAANKNQALS